MILLASGLAAALFGRTESEAIGLLRRAADRVARPAGLRYRGERRVTISAGGRSRTHVERVVRDGARLRIDFPGPSRFAGQTVIERGGDRRLYLPDRREVRRIPPFGVAAERQFARFARLATSGQVSASVAPGPVIAGWSTRLVTVRDGRSSPLGEFAIEPKTGVVLRRATFGPNGTAEGSSAFTSFQLLERVPAGAFDYAAKGWRTVTPADDLRRLSIELGVGFAALPPASGYRLDSARARGVLNRRVLASFYAGPNGRVTLFASTGDLPGARRIGKRGARVGVGVYGWRRGGTNYAFAGEASAEELAALAARVTFDPSVRLP